MSTYKLASIFRFYDKDGSESIDIIEFKKLIADALIVRDGTGKNEEVVDSIAKSVASQIPSASATNIGLQEFIAAVQPVPSPFNHPATGSPGLVTTLACPEFSPTYEFQVLSPWEAKKWDDRSFCWGLQNSIVDGDMRRKCKISDPLQVKFRIPALDERIGIRVNSSDTVQDLYKKISEHPLFKRRTFKPEPSTISLSRSKDAITVATPIVSPRGNDGKYWIVYLSMWIQFGYFFLVIWTCNSSDFARGIIYKIRRRGGVPRKRRACK